MRVHISREHSDDSDTGDSRDLRLAKVISLLALRGLDLLSDPARLVGIAQQGELECWQAARKAHKSSTAPAEHRQEASSLRVMVGGVDTTVWLPDGPTTAIRGSGGPSWVWGGTEHPEVFSDDSEQGGGGSESDSVVLPPRRRAQPGPPSLPAAAASPARLPADSDADGSGADVKAARPRKDPSFVRSRSVPMSPTRVAHWGPGRRPAAVAASGNSAARRDTAAPRFTESSRKRGRAAQARASSSEDSEESDLYEGSSSSSSSSYRRRGEPSVSGSDADVGLGVSSYGDDSEASRLSGRGAAVSRAAAGKRRRPSPPSLSSSSPPRTPPQARAPPQSKPRILTEAEAAAVRAARLNQLLAQTAAIMAKLGGLVAQQEEAAAGDAAEPAPPADAALSGALSALGGGAGGETAALSSESALAAPHSPPRVQTPRSGGVGCSSLATLSHASTPQRRAAAAPTLVSYLSPSAAAAVAPPAPGPAESIAGAAVPQPQLTLLRAQPRPQVEPFGDGHAKTAARPDADLSPPITHAGGDRERRVRQPVLVSGTVMHPHQLAGLSWLASMHASRLNGILADEMARP